MKGKDSFSFCGSSLNDISLYLKQEEAWIHHRKVLNSLCSHSCIVPYSNCICRRPIIGEKVKNDTSTMAYHYINVIYICGLWIFNQDYF